MSVKVSVIMPVYNAARFLGEAVESILSQTLREIELVAVDDGSTDASATILEDYVARDERVHVIRQANAGPSKARNRGIAEAHGQHIATMDADDVSMPNRLEMESRFLDEHPDYAAVSGQLMWVCTYGLPMGMVKRPTGHEQIERELLEGCGSSMPQPGLMMRASALREVGGYDETLRVGEDIDLCLRLARVGRLANLNEVVVNYRQHVGSLMHKRDEFDSECMRRMLARAREARGLPPEGQEMEWITADPPPEYVWHQRWAWNALKNKRRDVAWKHLKAAMRQAPLDRTNFRIVACIVRGR